jgi:hypothetical protein
LASLLAVGAAAAVSWLLLGAMPEGFVADAARVLASAVVAVGGGYWAMRWLRVEELGAVEGLLRTWGRRLRGVRSAAC